MTDKPDQLYVCDHAGECGRSVCAHSTPHEQDIAYAPFCDPGLCYAVNEKVHCIPAPEPVTEREGGE